MHLMSQRQVMDPLADPSPELLGQMFEHMAGTGHPKDTIPVDMIQRLAEDMRGYQFRYTEGFH